MLLFLLFVPEVAASHQAQTIIEEIASNSEFKRYEVKFHGDIPVFFPHVTIMGLEGSNVMGAKQAIKQSVLAVSEISLSVDAIRTTNYYFRSVLVFYEQSPAVTDLIKHLRESLKVYPDLIIKSSNESYIHMSLVYTSATLEQKQMIAKAPLKSQSGKTLDEIYPHGSIMKVSKVILISTEEDESPVGVRNWTVEAEYKLGGL